MQLKEVRFYFLYLSSLKHSNHHPTKKLKNLNTDLGSSTNHYPGPSLKSLEGTPTKQRGTPGNSFVIT